MALSFGGDRPVPLWLNAPAGARTPAISMPGARAATVIPRGAAARAALLVEACGFEAAAGVADAWSDLARRSLEPNPFMEPGFALAAAQHLPPVDRPTFVAVWSMSATGMRERLLGLWALALPRSILASGAAKLWFHKHSALGLPLLDAQAADAVVAATFAWFREQLPRIRVLLFPRVVRSGPTFARLLGYALDHGLEWRLTDQFERAVLRHDRGAALSGERRRKLNQRRRQLEQFGTVGFASAHTPADIRDAAEGFLVLEESGWKGRRRTALLSESSRAAFARTMTRRMAHAGKCRIDSLTIDGRPIAMAIVLQSGDQSFVWKIAYDEAFAAQSPGQQLVLEMTRVQQGDAAIRLTDSCADANHPMIDRLWPDRLPIVDLALPVLPAANEALIGFAWRSRIWRRLRSAAVARVRRLQSFVGR